MEQEMTSEHLGQEHRDEIPWVVFRLKKTHYAIYSGNIQGIMVLPEGLTPLPNMRDVFRGIIRQRGEVIPLMDLRLLFGMESSVDQIAAFSDMIEERKQDHIRWVHELRNCFESGEQFVLTTDPHSCAFGKWYDGFASDSLALAHQLKKIDEPHKVLHESGDKVLDEMVDKNEREKLLLYLENTLMPRILTVLDESVVLYHSINRGMYILLAQGDDRVGLVVDEVLSVEQLEMVADMGSCQYQTEYIKKVAKSSRLEGEILTVDDELLLQEGCGTGY